MTAQAVLAALNALQAVIGWLGHHGLARDHVITLLDQATAEGRDLTEAEVQAELDATATELDDTAALIDAS